MDNKPAPSIPQSFWDDNRQRFGAESFSIDVDRLQKPCPHVFYRYSVNEVRCKTCPAGWNDGNKFIIENGKLVGVRK